MRGLSFKRIRPAVQLSSSKPAMWLAIFSLIFSSVLTLTHNHGQSCDCPDSSHSHVTVSNIAGLENLQPGDCECTDCEPSAPHDHQQDNDHDKDSCSICRMVFEHANQTVEFELADIDEAVCDFVVFVISTPDRGVVSEYLTRGPPAPLA